MVHTILDAMVTEERAKFAMTIGSHDGLAGGQVLHGKTERVKFYTARIVNGKATYENKIIDDSRGNQDIIKGETREFCGVDNSNRQARTITNKNARRMTQR